MYARSALTVSTVLLVLGSSQIAVAQTGTDTEVSVGSPASPFPQNKQNEPAVAIDANHPNVVAAGSNDEIDLAPCGTADATPAAPCPFTPGVGVSGVHFSFDSGHTWVQPTYTGWSARDGVPKVGPIGTLPWYFENGLVSDGDPALAFGPVPRNGRFSWANGSRLYYANLTSNFSAARSEQTFKGFEALAVSRTDNVAAAAAGVKSAWMPPVIASRQNAALFEDKEQLWADNASSSAFFGNVYLCSSAFRGVPGRSQTLILARSADGGATWTQRQVAPASNNIQHFGRSGCTIRTDSRGVVYAFYEEFNQARTLPPHGTHMLVKSFDGGVSWTRPQRLFNITDPCFFIDPTQGRCVQDGLAGARNDLAASPSVDIDNGAPTGAGATNEIIDAWSDGRLGLNNEKTMVAWSTNGGRSWSAPQIASRPGDRPIYSAPAVIRGGGTMYVVYMAFGTPFQTTTANPRTLYGVVRASPIGAGGAPTGWTTLHVGATGDARASSANALTDEFLGDYVYAATSRTYAVSVWTDVRNAADCPAIDAFRQALLDGEDVLPPLPTTACPPTFGNTDIFGFTTAP